MPVLNKIPATASSTLNKISSLKFQRNIEGYMTKETEEKHNKHWKRKEIKALTPREKAKAQKQLLDGPQYYVNPKAVIPTALSLKESALFVYKLMQYWREKGVYVVYSCADNKKSEIWFKPGSNCGACENGQNFAQKMFGVWCKNDWQKLPFVTHNASYIVITAKALKEFSSSCS